MSAKNARSDYYQLDREESVSLDGTPEQRLAVAVIIRALADYHKRIKHGPRKSAYVTQYLLLDLELEDWLFDDNFESPEPFTFPWLLCCISERPQAIHERILNFIKSPEFGRTMSATHSRNYVGRFVKNLFH